MISLKDQLIEKTQNLKNSYIDQIVFWSKNNYKLIQEKQRWVEVDWCKYFMIEPRKANPGTKLEFLTFPTGFYNTKNSKIYEEQKRQIKSILKLSLEEYIEKERKEAEIHYIQSIDKLIFRLKKKGFDEAKEFSIESSKIGPNFECLIHFHDLNGKENTIKAWTIVASGSIQRPHYRYLVK